MFNFWSLKNVFFLFFKTLVKCIRNKSFFLNRELGVGVWILSKSRDLCSFPWWKEPKIKAVVLLLKRKSRNYSRFRSDALYFVRSWNVDFAGDLLRSFRQKSDISVRSQNPTIPRLEVILNWELLFINEINFRAF